jgi:cysteine synthase A
MMPIRPDLSAAIGHTPLLRLRHASALTGCEILGKAEFLNPGGSIKDRTALGLLLDAEQRGLIRHGGSIVEGTAGNTGIGLALLGASRGYRTVIFMPETQSREKIDALRIAGAEVRLVPAVPYKDPNHYAHQARAHAEAANAADPGSAWFANQFDNTANRDWHEATTGVEIWQDAGGHVDGFVCAAGTGDVQRVDLLAALRFRHEDHRAIAAAGAEQGQPDPGIAGGALDDAAAGADQPAPLGIQQQAQRGAVLDRAAGVEELGFAQDLAAGQRGGVAQAQQWRVADGGGEVGDAHGGRFGRGVSILLLPLQAGGGWRPKGVLQVRGWLLT